MTTITDSLKREEIRALAKTYRDEAGLAALESIVEAAAGVEAFSDIPDDRLDAVAAALAKAMTTRARAGQQNPLAKIRRDRAAYAKAIA